MRNLATIVLGLFLASSLLSALAEHCVPGLDEVAGISGAAAATHETEPRHHDGKSEKGDCAVAGSQVPANLPATAPAPAPSVKVLAVLWTKAALGALVAPPEDGRLHPDFSGTARGSPPFAAVFARTGRLLI